MRVMSYNILNGGRDGSDERRWRDQVQLIADARPDVLLVQEARGFDRDGAALLHRAESDLGMRGFLAVAPHTGQHTAVFIAASMRPLSFRADSAHFHHALAALTVQVAGFEQPITFASMHLSPLSPALRAAEVGWLADLAAPDAVAIVGGDANSLAPTDPEPPDWNALAAHHRVRYLGADGRSDRSALEFATRAGLVDLGAQLNEAPAPTVPARGFPDAEFVPFRSDYFLASPLIAARARSYAVVDDERAHHASDHLPILATIDLD